MCKTKFYFLRPAQVQFKIIACNNNFCIMVMNEEEQEELKNNSRLIETLQFITPLTISYEKLEKHIISTYEGSNKSMRLVMEGIKTLTEKYFSERFCETQETQEETAKYGNILVLSIGYDDETGSEIEKFCRMLG